VTGLGILVAKVSFPHALSIFQAATQLETLSCQNYNEVVLHPAGRVNSQKVLLQLGPQPQLQQVHQVISDTTA
jgi:hypothetical protein